MILPSPLTQQPGSVATIHIDDDACFRFCSHSYLGGIGRFRPSHRLDGHRAT